MTIALTVNGKAESVAAEPDTPLLWVLRERLARTMHHAISFLRSGERMRADVPSGGIGVRQLVMQRVRG